MPVSPQPIWKHILTELVLVIRIGSLEVFRILPLRDPAEAISVAGGSMAGMLGGSLDSSLSRLVATMGINYHQSSNILSIFILMSQSSFINYQSSIIKHQPSSINIVNHQP